MQDVILSGQKYDGIWTSGLGQRHRQAYVENGEPLVPIVGADSLGFIQFLNGEGNGTTVTPEDGRSSVWGSRTPAPSAVLA